jgi:hypothetical protein
MISAGHAQGAALRKAFADAVHDPALIAETDALKLDMTYRPPQDLERLVAGASASLSLRRGPLTEPSSGFPLYRVALSPQAGRGAPRLGAGPNVPSRR